MREMSTADKQWLRQELRSAVRQVLYEEFGEVLEFLRLPTGGSAGHAVPYTDERPTVQAPNRSSRRPE